MVKPETGAFGPVARWIDRQAGACGDPPPAWAVELVESADPISVPVALKQRMLLSLGAGRPRPRQPWLRPVVVCAVLLGGTAVASAAFTRWPADLVGVCRTLVGGPPLAQGAAPAVEGGGARSAARAAMVASPADGAALDAADLPVSFHPLADGRRRAKPHPSAHEDPALVVAATRALRVERDPRRARLLAARYLREHPRGGLAEEALAIEVEAAMDHHDGDTSALAFRYLSLYPHGAFREATDRALSAP